ncbi:3399_t:CDS:2, partial [Acaulospora colombiana]
ERVVEEPTREPIQDHIMDNDKKEATEMEVTKVEEPIQVHDKVDQTDKEEEKAVELESKLGLMTLVIQYTLDLNEYAFLLPVHYRKTRVKEAGAYDLLIATPRLGAGAAFSKPISRYIRRFYRLINLVVDDGLGDLGRPDLWDGHSRLEVKHQPGGPEISLGTSVLRS